MIKPQQVTCKYNDSFDLEIEYNKDDEGQSFNLDFYASDDEDDTNVGELTDIHSGSIEIIFDICPYCSDWLTIAPVIPKEKFVGWNRTLHPKWECLDYAKEQLRVVGFQLKSEGWSVWTSSKHTKNPDVFQFYLEEDVAGMKAGVQKDQVKSGVAYLKESLQKGIAVIAGVDDRDNYNGNDDNTTEHFIVIVGMGVDENVTTKESSGKYFLFYDNAEVSEDIVTSSENKLYCCCKEHVSEGIGDLGNRYIQNTEKKRYRITQIRKTKEN